MDVNVHPAKTEVKFLNEKAVFDCVHYGVLGALNQTPDRPAVQFKSQPVPASAAAPATPPSKAAPPKQENFFRTMTAEEYKTFSAALKDAPRPNPAAAAAAAAKVERTAAPPLRETVSTPAAAPAAPKPEIKLPPLPEVPPRKKPAPIPTPPPAAEEPEQESLNMPAGTPWRMVGELYNTYILVEQGDNAFLIDKHAAHERILFEKLKANQEGISAQALLTPVPVRLAPEAAGELLANRDMLDELGFEIDEFGENTLLLRQIPMDLSADDAAEALEAMAANLLNGRRAEKDTVRDEVLHTVACKAAIKAGWRTDEAELLALVKQVMAREDLKYCPHGRPICVTLSKKQLEKQFRRT